MIYYKLDLGPPRYDSNYVVQLKFTSCFTSTHYAYICSII